MERRRRKKVANPQRCCCCCLSESLTHSLAYGEGRADGVTCRLYLHLHERSHDYQYSVIVCSTSSSLFDCSYSTCWLDDDHRLPFYKFLAWRTPPTLIAASLSILGCAYFLVLYFRNNYYGFVIIEKKIFFCLLPDLLPIWKWLFEKKIRIMAPSDKNYFLPKFSIKITSTWDKIFFLNIRQMSNEKTPTRAFN